MTEPVVPREAYLTWAEIDLQAIKQNQKLLRSLTAPGTAFFAVIKADAYGHGAVAVAQTLKQDVDYFCVARVEEAAELRAAGIENPILVLAPPLGPQAALAASLNCALVVCHLEHLEAVIAAANATGQRQKVHVKIDVGMGRLGLKPEDAVAFVQRAASEPLIEIEGVMSHLPCADNNRDSPTAASIETFIRVREQIIATNIPIRYFHLANSAATIDHPASHFNAVRVGISLYGQYPSLDMQPRLTLHPAMTLKTRIAFLKSVPAGTGLSYSLTYVTPQPAVVATVPLGYADGYPRQASNLTYMIIRGKQAPVLGRICMDHILLDVTDIPDVAIGDEVMAFGTTGNVTLSAEKVADTLGSIGYELTTRIGKRVPKFYTPQ